MARAILHVDMDAFYASVEQRDDPALRGKPVLVGGRSGRGVVCAASYEARVFGCRSAMPMAVALRKCPQAIVVKPEFRKYREASDIVFATLGEFSPLVEPLSLDEAFVDVTGSVRLMGPPRRMAERIRALVRERTQLTCSVGVAHCKFLAKLASDLKKPDALVEMPSDEAGLAAILDPLPISVIWGVGPAAAKRLHVKGVRTIADVKRLTEPELQAALGSFGPRVWRLVRGLDDRPVVPDRQSKSIGHEETFAEDIHQYEEIRGVLLGHVEQVARRLRRAGLKARGVTLKLRSPEFETVTRSRTLDHPTDETTALWKAGSAVFEEWWGSSKRYPLRLLGFTVHDLTDGSGEQLELFGGADAPDGQRPARSAAIDKATDAIAAKFGAGAIRRGGSLGPDRERVPTTYPGTRGT